MKPSKGRSSKFFGNAIIRQKFSLDAHTNSLFSYSLRPRRRALTMPVVVVVVAVAAVVALSFAVLVRLDDAMKAAGVAWKKVLSYSSKSLEAVLAAVAGTMGKDAQSLMPQRFSPHFIQKCLQNDFCEQKVVSVCSRMFAAATGQQQQQQQQKTYPSMPHSTTFTKRFLRNKMLLVFAVECSQQPKGNNNKNVPDQEFRIM
jgi:hypothetical protein